MKISIDSGSLAKALKAVSKAIPAKTTVPILECIKMETGRNRLILTATGNELTLKVPVPISETQEEGACAIPAKKITDLMSLVPEGNVTLYTVEDKSVVIRWEKGEQKLPLMDIKEFPAVATPEEEFSVFADPQMLAPYLGMALSTCAKDGVKNALAGIHFDIKDGKLNLVSSDSRMLTCGTIECETENKSAFTIPYGSAAIIKASIRKDHTTLKISCDKKSVVFNLGDVIVQSRIMTEKFPNYETIIPKKDTVKGELTVNRNEILTTVKRLANCSNKLRMKAEPLALIFSCQDTTNGTSASEECTCEYAGESIEIGLNAQNFINVIENTASEELSLSLTGEKKPLLLEANETTTDHKAVSLLMPIML